jgi:hypothetical protein
MIEPGFALAAAINSAMFFMGNAGFTATTSGLTPTIDTGAKLFIES